MKKKKLRLRPSIKIGLLLIGIVSVLAFLTSSSKVTSLVTYVKEMMNGNEPYAYISDIKLIDVVDGSAPFDNLIADQEKYDEDGNVLSYAYGDDSSSSNGIVRSFDTVSYNIETKFEALENTKSYTDANVYFEAVLERDITEAKFDVDSMKWIDSYTITYYDKEGKVLATGTDENPNYWANDHATDSTAGENSYKTEVVKQVIVGKYNLKGDTDSTIVIPGTKTFNVVIKVLAARNGTEIKPTFKFWVENNDININRDKESLNQIVTPKKTIVSAVPRYNAKIIHNATFTYLNNFDLETGSTSQSIDENVVHGKMTSFGVMLQLYNEYHGDEEGASVSTKGFKGVELPRGDITFDLQFTEIGYSLEDGTDVSYTPILWDYKINDNVNNGNLGRTMHWNNHPTDRTSPQIPMGWSVPILSTSKKDSVYYPGEILKTSEKNLSSNSNKYQFTISNYDFDLDTFSFPTHSFYKNPPESNWNEYIGVFGAYNFHVILQFPEQENLGTDQSLYLNSKIDNLKIKSLSGLDASDFSKNEVTDDDIFQSEVNYKDNKTNNPISLFTKGYIQIEHSITNDSSSGPFRDTLSPNYWFLNSDATAFMGQSVKLWTTYHLFKTSDLSIKNANLLLKFDSEIFELKKKNEIYYYSDGVKLEKTTEKFLYAADPLYPNGWRTNVLEEHKRMNNAAEEDLIYFESLEELESAGYTCIGVLAEVRNFNQPANESNRLSLGLEVIIKNNNNLVNKTYAHTSAVRVWTNESDMNNITWSNANNNLTEVQEDLTEFKNSLDDYIMPNLKQEKMNYVKVEFEDGVLVTGTHNGGHQYGMSVLIVGYNTSVSLDSTKDYYDLDKGERIATFKIKPSINFDGNNTSNRDTELKIKINVDENLTFLNNSLESSGIKISSDKKQPSLLPDNEGYNYKAYYQVEDNGVYVYLSDVRVINQTLPEIYFDVIIGHAGEDNDVNNNDTLSSTVSISGSEDLRVVNETNGNIASKNISIIKLAGTSLGKTTMNEIIEKNESITYNIIYTNNSNVDLDNFNLYDVLPYNNDFRGSKFSGDYEVSNISFIFKNDTKNSAKIYYSNNEEDRVFTSSEADKKINQFNEYSTGNVDAKVIGVKATGLSPNSSLTITFTLKTSGNNSKDLYVNNSFIYNPDLVEGSQLNSPYAQTQVVERIISGIAFEDLDNDNLYTLEDKLFKNINVKLLNSNNEEIATTTTNDSGYYEFKVPSKGNYYVQFDVPNGYEIISKGSQDNANKSNINGITDIVNHSNIATNFIEKVENINVGFRVKKANLIVHHYIEGTTTKLADDETYIYNYLENYETSSSSKIDPDYEIVELPTNATGTINQDEIVVIYYYKLKETTLTVHHYIENTSTKLVPDEVSNVKYKDEYTTSPSKDVSSNYEVVGIPSNATGIIKGATEVTYYYKLKEANLVVKHLEVDTNNVLAPEESSTVYYGETYTTKESKDIPNNYELLKKTENYTGIVSTPTIEVIYYYQKKDSSLETSINKEGPEEITKKDEIVQYKIIYNASVKDYIGAAIITITDTLPYPINEELSSLDGGVYDEESNTITWTEDWKDINSYEDESLSSTKEIIKNISVVYEGIDARDRIMVNSVKGNIKLDNNERNIEDQISTNIKIPGKIIVHYYLKDTTTKLIDDVESSGLVGEEFISESKDIEGYNLVKTPTTEHYYYEENVQEVIYEYEKIVLEVKTFVKGVGGTIQGNESVIYGENSTKDFIVVLAAEGYQIKSVYINGEYLEIEQGLQKLVLDQFLDMSENKEVIVEFEKIPEDDEYIDVLAPNTKLKDNTFILTILILSSLMFANVILKYSSKKNK